MHNLKNTYKQSIRYISIALIAVLGWHFVSIHGFANSLILCFEGNGQLTVESDVGPLFSVASANRLEHDSATDVSNTTHQDISLSSLCSKEQVVTSVRLLPLKLLGRLVLKTFPHFSYDQIPRYALMIPHLIEDRDITSLKTVVLLN